MYIYLMNLKFNVLQLKKRELFITSRRAASQFFLISLDSRVDEALANPIIFRISQNGDEKKSKISFYNNGLIEISFYND